MSLGIICRMDAGGLSYQTHNLARMLRPSKLMVIDSTSFNGSAQYPEWYDGFQSVRVNGFPSNLECSRFLNGLTHLLTCETFYNHNFVRLAKVRRVSTINAPNYEFLDNLRDPGLPIPDVFLMPSRWKLEEMQGRYRNVRYLPPPLFANDFAKDREANFARQGRRRFLHVVGKMAHADRNGTDTVIEALKHTTAPFELVIKSQYPVDLEVNDHRVSLDFRGPANNASLYKDFDALIFPRRYGGLTLVMNEALMSGLPVIMTDISPNNLVLPHEWLVQAEKVGEFMARTIIDVYGADPWALAKKIDEFVEVSDDDLLTQKINAFQLAYDNFSSDILKRKYEELLGEN